MRTTCKIPFRAVLTGLVGILALFGGGVAQVSPAPTAFVATDATADDANVAAGARAGRRARSASHRHPRARRAVARVGSLVRPSPGAAMRSRLARLERPPRAPPAPRFA